MGRQVKISDRSSSVSEDAPARPTKFVGIALTLIAGMLAVVSTAFLTRDFTILAITAIETNDVSTAVQLLVLYVPVYVLLYGAFSYIATRYGHFKREGNGLHHDDLDAIFDGDVAELLVLVPSYKEETAVIRQTLLSAALLEYPAKRVVLLIDNPPDSRNAEDQRLLNTTRQLVVDLQALFQHPAECLAQELEGFLTRSRQAKLDLAAERRRVSSLYMEVSEWFEAQAKRLACSRSQPGSEHVD